MHAAPAAHVTPDTADPASAPVPPVVVLLQPVRLNGGAHCAVDEDHALLHELLQLLEGLAPAYGVLPGLEVGPAGGGGLGGLRLLCRARGLSSLVRLA